MPKKIQFEWELPDTLVEAIVQDPAKAVEAIKQAAVLNWVRMHKLSLRRGAELLQMTYRDFLALMAEHRMPSIDYEEGWLAHELGVFDHSQGKTQP
jgi:predicted HTH domain antitoxin